MQPIQKDGGWISAPVPAGGLTALPDLHSCTWTGRGYAGEAMGLKKRRLGKGNREAG